MALFLARAGLKMEAVLYKGGGPAIADVVAGHVPCYFGNLNEILPHAGGGKINVLAVSGETRARAAPAGADGGRAGLSGLSHGHVERLRRARRPRRTSIVERVAREIAAGCKDAAFVARLDKIGVDAVCSTPASSSALCAKTSLSGRKPCGGRNQAAMNLRVAIPDLISPSYFPAIAAVELAASGRRASTPRSSSSTR